MKKLTKTFRLIWNNNLQIIQNSENGFGSTTSTIKKSFESDIKQDITNKIIALGLIENSQII